MSLFDVQDKFVHSLEKCGSHLARTFREHLANSVECPAHRDVIHLVALRRRAGQETDESLPRPLTVSLTTELTISR